MVAQTTRFRARMCLFENFLHCFSFRGSKTPKNPNFGAWIGVFKSKSQNQKNVHIIKATASIPTKFCTVIKTTKCPLCVVPTQASQIQDGGRPTSWKNRIIVISQSRFGDFDEIWHDDAVRPSRPPRPLKIWNFQNPRWRRPSSWNINKSQYLGRVWVDFNEIWRGVVVQPFWPPPPFKIWNFENPRWRRPPSWKIDKSRYLGRVWVDFNEIWRGNVV